MLRERADPQSAHRNTGAGFLRSNPAPLPTAESKGRGHVTQTLEQDEAQEEPTPAVSPETVIEEEAEEEAAHERETAGDDAVEGRASGPQNEREVKALGKKIDAERERHAKKLSDLLGDAAPDALPCPLCFEGLQGFVLPGDAASLPDDQKAAALAFLGQDAPSELRPAEGAVMCDRCDGFGQLAWPTRNPHLQTQTCPKCSGNGYVLAQQQQATVTNLPGVVTQADAAQNGVVMPCSRCGAPNSEGRPHFCNPQPQ